MPNKNKCKCCQILGRDKVYIHLYGCPESDEVKEYLSKPWYKRIFSQDPAVLYNEHLRP